MLFPEESIQIIYDYNPFLFPATANIQKYLEEKKNYFASKIQIWYQKNKIDKEVPFLSIDELRYFPKWHIIRLYMKFYPKQLLLVWPFYCSKHVKSPIKTAYDVFQFMKTQNKQSILSTENRLSMV